MHTETWTETPSIFKARIIGKLLGDGSITKQENRKARFQFLHVDRDYGYCKYYYDQLAPFIPLNPPKFKKSTDPRLIDGYSLSYYVQSKTSHTITYLRSKWYPDTKKIIPKQLISEHFTEQSLAWWYMDDGHLKLDGSIPRKIILSTDSFATEENNWLINFLWEKYKLNFSLDGQNRLILYDQFQIHYFLYLVTPSLHESMYRKTLPLYYLKKDVTAKRTTIYLPSEITLHSPTKEIDKALPYLTHMIGQYKREAFYQAHQQILFPCKNVKTKDCQIIIGSQNLSNLQFMKGLTGLTFSKLTELCFLLDEEST